MNVKNITKGKDVLVALSIDDIKTLCNALYNTDNKEKDNSYWKLYSDMMIARDLCEYGHIDNFCLEQVKKARNQIIEF